MTYIVPYLTPFTPVTDMLRTHLPLSLASLLCIGMAACASSLPQAPTPEVSPAASHLCQPMETVGFTCQLQDRRLLSVCASTNFETFKGTPQDNPGHAYVVVGTADTKQRQSYPGNPRDYARHMSTGTTLSGQPYLVVATEKGPFLYINADAEIPVSSTAANLPQDWSLSAPAGQSLCVQRGRGMPLDQLLMQLPRKPR